MAHESDPKDRLVLGPRGFRADFGRLFCHMRSDASI